MRNSQTGTSSITLGGRLITLRPLTRDDSAAVQAFAQTIPLHDLLFLQRDIRHSGVVAAWMNQIESGEIASLLALDGETILGCTALVRDKFSWSPHVAEIRLLLGADSRGTGLGRWLAQQVLGSAQDAGVEKLFVRMTPDQSSALKVFEEMGFLPEALLRNHVRDAQGETHDIAIMALDLNRMSSRHQIYGLGE